MRPLTPMKGDRRGFKPPKIHARYFLRSKVVKGLRRESVERFGVQLFPKRAIEEIVLKDGTAVLAVDRRPRAFRRGGILYPTLHALIDGALRLPRVVVDRGAVPHVVNGADVMAPGIARMDAGIARGSLVVVTEETYDRPIAVGVALMSSEEVTLEGRGRAVENLHYLGDRIWALGGGL
ncbi:TPA: RNA-binding protein [Candidatus Bathyarchaeota archaeon]|nr:RNA-binding protein [Candidatus Bathyarchaeota archaeon]